jgi:hypothetical protein
MEDKEVFAFLSENPGLMNSVKKLVAVAKKGSSPDRADDAEDMIIGASRELNKEMLQVWSNDKISEIEGRFEKKHPRANKEVKKNSTGIVRSGKSK